VIRLLFPEGLFALVILCPLFFFLILSWHQEKEVIRAFLLQSGIRIFIAEAVAVTAAAVFLVLTLTRPVLVSSDMARIKLADDTAVILVFDVSRSMLAQEKPYAPTRLERARLIGQDLTRKLEVQMGVAGFTDVVLFHIFPTNDLIAVRYAIDKTVQIESVPFGGYARSGRLDSIVEDYTSFFPEEIKHKIIIVFTDGDMPAIKQNEDTDSLRKQGVDVFFVGIGTPGELIYQYNAQGKLVGVDQHVTNFNENVLLESARVLGGEYFSENNSAQIVDEVKRAVGKESFVDEIAERRKAIELTPLTALASFSALMFFLYLRRPS